MQKIQYKAISGKRFGTDEEIIRVQAISHGRITLDDITRQLGRSIVGISEGTVHTVIEGLNNQLEEHLGSGNTVDMGSFVVKLTVKGSLESVDDSIDLNSGKNSIKVLAKPTKKLMNFLKENVQFEKDSTPNQTLQIQSFKNVHTNTDDSFSSMEFCEIRGYKLKFKKSSEEDGVYLVNIAGEQTKVNIISENTHRRIGFSIPRDLPVGNYQILLKSTVSGSLKTGSFSKTVTCI